MHRDSADLHTSVRIGNPLGGDARFGLNGFDLHSISEKPGGFGSSQDTKILLGVQNDSNPLGFRLVDMCLPSELYLIGRTDFLYEALAAGRQAQWVARRNHRALSGGSNLPLKDW
jgi:hypothetical protein